MTKNNLYFNMSMSNGIKHGLQVYSSKLEDYFRNNSETKDININFLKIKNTKFLSVYRLYWNFFILPFKARNEPVYSFSSHGSPFCKNQIITIHDLICFSFPKQHKFQYYYFKFLLPLVLKSCKKVVVISEFTKNEVIKYYNLSEDKIEVIHNGLNSFSYNEDIETEDNFSKIVGNKPFFISVGASYKHKNIENLLLAIKSSSLTAKECNFIIISKKNEYGENLRTIGKDLNLDNVIFLEQISDNLLAKLYKESISNIYLSLYEGFGFPPLEAASLGKVSLLSNIGVFKEVMEDCAIFVNPLNIEEISLAICDLYNKKIDLKPIENKFQFLLKKYSWETTGAKIEKLIFECLMK